MAGVDGLPVFPVRFFIVFIKRGKIAGGDLFFNNILNQCFCMFRGGARHRCQNPGGTPGGYDAFFDQFNDIIIKCLQQGKTPGNKTFTFTQKTGNLALR